METERERNRKPKHSSHHTQALYALPHFLSPQTCKKTRYKRASRAEIDAEVRVERNKKSKPSSHHAQTLYALPHFLSTQTCKKIRYKRASRAEIDAGVRVERKEKQQNRRLHPLSDLPGTSSLFLIRFSVVSHSPNSSASHHFAPCATYLARVGSKLRQGLNLNPVGRGFTLA